MESQAACSRCTHTCDGPPADTGTLHLKFPLTHTYGKVLSMFAHSIWQYTQHNGIVSTEVQSGGALDMLKAIQAILTPQEQIDVRVLFQPHGRPLMVEDAMATTSLTGFVAKLQSTWLTDMLREGRLATAYQPIVDVNAPETIFAYECLMRGQEGERIIAPFQMLEIARGADLLFQLDLAARLAAIRGAADHQLTSKIFINFNPTAIYDPVFCLRSTISTIKELEICSEQIVFEVVESDQVADLSHLKNIVNHYRKEGFQVALDDLGSGFSSLNMLHQLRPDYVKLDMQLIRNVHQDPYKASITRKLLEAAKELQIQTIAEGVETAEEYAWIRENGADFAQGYYIAKPALVPPITLNISVGV